MKNRGILIALLVVLLGGVVFTIVWKSRDGDPKAPTPGPGAGPGTPGPGAGPGPPVPVSTPVEPVKLHNPPTKEDITRLASLPYPSNLPREARPRPEWEIRTIRENIAMMVGEGSIERIKPSLLGYAPGDLAEALDAATVAVLQAKHASVPPAGRCLSAWLLGKSSDGTVSAFLAAQLAQEKDVSVCVAILCALQSREDEAAGAAIAQALANATDATVRVAAAHALGTRAGRSDGARAALIGSLSLATEDEGVRVACAQTLGGIPAADAAKALVAALGSDRPRLREAAAWSLPGQQAFLDPAWLDASIAAEPEGPVRDALRAADRAKKGIPEDWPKEGCGAGR